ncbi:5'-methylthioadenosine/S-adenosylhomocysteine nucleosidase [Virgibacillus sp. 179-BFC.A HS]|uniref:adenosylhomocysteine nucleosidase n=1 Tax=Tigheibacillus jepli TaxID=3035914 RepID=A0ABU5CGQ9_9BACI|nr:5'-methylthioadenosine/S-adenosylhomocysteine nucleosidase [Virgibacillus sp. 179-BFC.A HS]MDY0405504.1 5'-methylthioadenosine/S-adenosylhomocysteine nucleosidase [Virgibacillus sp. 179-BFC.A HS]
MFITGKLQSKDIVLLQSGIGKVNAAMACTILHERFAPKKVINTGSAGGLDENLEVGDIVISSQTLYHDVDVTAFDYAYGQVPGMPPAFASDPELIDMTTKAVKGLPIKAKIGMIATGDSFMSDKNRVTAVKNQFPDLLAAEMEAAAIAQVCYRYECPFIVIRALSDIAGKESSISFDAFLDQAATNAATLIMDVLNQM